MSSEENKEVCWDVRTLLFYQLSCIFQSSLWALLFKYVKWSFFDSDVTLSSNSIKALHFSMNETSPFHLAVPILVVLNMA